MAESRLIGTYPVIGIRPTIDGRRGYLKVKKETFIKKAGSYVGLLRRYGLYAALYYIRALRDSLII